MRHILKMMALTIGLAAVIPAAGADEVRLSGVEILEMLNNQTALYDDGAKQYFSKDGGTLYISARGVHEQGRWRVEGDQYCSHWGRSWDCYEMTGAGSRVSWLTTFGKDYKAEMVAGNRL